MGPVLIVIRPVGVLWLEIATCSDRPRRTAVQLAPTMWKCESTHYRRRAVGLASAMMSTGMAERGVDFVPPPRRRNKVNGAPDDAVSWTAAVNSSGAGATTNVRAARFGGASAARTRRRTNRALVARAAAQQTAHCAGRLRARRCAHRSPSRSIVHFCQSAAVYSVRSRGRASGNRRTSSPRVNVA